MLYVIVVDNHTDIFVGLLQLS